MIFLRKTYFSLIVLNPKTKRQSPRRTWSFDPLEGKRKYFSAPVTVRPRFQSELKQPMSAKGGGLRGGQSVVSDQFFLLTFPAWI